MSDRDNDIHRGESLTERVLASEARSSLRLRADAAERAVSSLRSRADAAEAKLAALVEAMETIRRSGAPGGSILAARRDEHRCGWCRGMYTPCPVAVSEQSGDLSTAAAQYTARVKAMTLRAAAEWLACSPAPSSGVKKAAAWLRAEAEKIEALDDPTKLEAVE